MKGCRTIFELAGYSTSEPGVFLLSKVDMKHVVDVAFECLVASEECGIMHNIHRQLKKTKISWDRIVQCRQMTRGNATNVVDILREVTPGDSHFKERGLMLNRSASGRLQGSNHIANKTGQFHNGHSSQDLFGHTFPNVDYVPYIDTVVRNKTLEERTHDEHLQASLRLVNLDHSRTPESSNRNSQKSTDEWSFVRHQLEKEHGKEYFNGSRGDFLNDPQEMMLSQTDEGIGTASHVHTSTTQCIATEDLYSADQRPKSKVNSELKMNVYRQSLEDQGVNSGVSGISYPPYQLLVARSGTTSMSSQSLYKKIEPSGLVESGEENIFSKGSVASISDRKNVISVSSEKRLVSKSAPLAVKGEYPISQRIRPKSVSTEMKVWTCPHCTVVNSLDQMVCYVCSKSRDSVDGDLSRGDRILSKVCDVCTLANRTDAEICQACHCRLNGLNTIV